MPGQMDEGDRRGGAPQALHPRDVLPAQLDPVDAHARPARAPARGDDHVHGRRRDRARTRRLAGHAEPERAVRHRRSGRARLGQVVGERADEVDAAAPAREEASPHRRLDRRLGKPACTEIGGGDDATGAGRLGHELEVARFRPVRGTQRIDCAESAGLPGAFRTVDLERCATARNRGTAMAHQANHGIPRNPRAARTCGSFLNEPLQFATSRRQLGAPGPSRPASPPGRPSPGTASRWRRPASCRRSCGRRGRRGSPR